jgi:DNA-binding XRE family transcriptional regulator
MLKTKTWAAKAAATSSAKRNQTQFARQTGFPRTLRAARLSLTLTQSDLAAAVGVLKQTVSGWECGAAVPPMRTMLDLCRALNLTLDQLTKETP